MTRKKYSKEFKLDAIALVLEQGYSRSEAARSLDINANMLGRWIKEHQAQDDQAFRGNGKLTEEQAEIRKLKEQVRRLEMEKEILKKANGLLCQRNEVKYSFIAQHKKTWPVDLMCQLLGVKRHGYYSYMRRRLNQQVDPNRNEKVSLVREIVIGSDFTYGSRRVCKAMGACGFPITRNKARRLMNAAGVAVKQRKKYKVTTNSNHKKPVYDNVLDRQFKVEAPDQAYVSDITYIWTQEGWLYLAVVIDLFSRKVVSWSLGKRMTAGLVCDALTMAVWQRCPPPGLIVHSDQGSQYASHDYRNLIKKNQFIGSMSPKGNCWDNAVAESFFGTLKQERVQWRNYQTRQAALTDIRDYIVMHYNEKRLHSYIGYVSPNDFERACKQIKKVA
ncbi:IS3 family transposase [Reinekea marinisedimentorum]